MNYEYEHVDEMIQVSKATPLSTRTALIAILREMGTDLNPYAMQEWELLEEIIRRIVLAKGAVKRLKNSNKDLQRKIEVLSQISIYDILQSFKNKGETP